MTQPNADKLKGCPCCSGASVPEVRWEPDSEILTYSAHIKCTKCFLRTAGGTVNSKAAVDELLKHEIRDWNTRPAPRVGEDVVGVMVEAFISAPYIGDLKIYAKASMQAAITAAEAMGYTLTKQAWQTMDSAPRDGTRVLATDGMNEADVAYFAEGRWFSQSRDYNCWAVAEPTHWQPLPAPPAGEKGE